MIYLLFFFFSIAGQNNSNCDFCGEYKGGRKYFEWISIEIKSNGRYEYKQATHTQMSIHDRGNWNWEREGNQLYLKSKKKIY
ncbi:MAG: hypothetical protein AAFO82_17675, partial [Bacteroidota bacterium]